MAYMLRRCAIFLIFLASLSCPLSPVFAEFVYGNKLYQMCMGNEWERDVCIGYVLAIADEIGFSPAGKRACFGENVTPSQVVDIVKNWMSAHPEERDYPASRTVSIALELTFPCKNAK